MTDAGSYGPFRPVGFFMDEVAQISSIEEHDNLATYCAQLGGEIPFRYCRTVNQNLPCRRILVCWEFRIEIAKFLTEHYSFEQIGRALAPLTKTKVETILDLIEKARKIKEEEG